MYWSFRMYMYVHYMYVHTPILHPHPCTHAYGFHEKSYPSWRTRILQNLYPGIYGFSQRSHTLENFMFSCYTYFTQIQSYSVFIFNSYTAYALYKTFVELFMNPQTFQGKFNKQVHPAFYEYTCTFNNLKIKLVVV